MYNIIQSTKTSLKHDYYSISAKFMDLVNTPPNFKRFFITPMTFGLSTKALMHAVNQEKN